MRSQQIKPCPMIGVNRQETLQESLRRHRLEAISQIWRVPDWNHQDCLDILNKKCSFPGSFISIPEIQAENKVLKHCGLPNEEYLVLFIPRYRQAMMLVGEAYPLFRGNYYMTVIREEHDCIKEFASFKESKVIEAPESWLDLRIKGSQLSQYFRRKCKHSPKGLFSYPADVNGTRYSLHWVSEAHIETHGTSFSMRVLLLSEGNV